MPSASEPTETDVGIVVFAASCPSCGHDCTWQQGGDGATVKPEDFTVGCNTCPPCAA